MTRMDEKMEIRTLEVRVDGSEEEPRLVGYAVRWGERSQPLPFIERFQPGAFAKALAGGRDVLALVDHDRSKVLARRSNGTLELVEDDQGLLVTIRPNVETSYGRDVVAAVRRGDVSGMSVGFIARREQWVPDEEAGQVREIIEADLREVSVESMPAYVGTSVQARKETMHVEERKEKKAVAVATETEQESRETPKVSETRQEERTVPKVEPVLSTPVAERRSAFASYLRGEPYDTRALTLSPATAGGYLAPESFQAELIRALNERSVMRRIAQVVGPIAAASIKWPKLASGPTAAWLDEATAITPSDAVFDQIVFTPHKLGVMTLVSNELLSDSALNVETLLAQLFGEEFAAVEDVAFFSGSGTGEPEGVLTNADVQTVAAASGATVDKDDILALYDALPPQYRENAVWVMHPSTMSVLRLLEDTVGRPLLVESLAASAPTTLLGRPVYLSSNVPEIALNAKTILFGDFARAYKIVDRQGIDVQRSGDRYFEQDVTAFRAIKRVDAKVVLPDALRVLQQPAA